MTAPGGEAELVARLLERLLADPDLRAAFRHDPPAVCRSAGLVGLADELGRTSGAAMRTLAARESRSSLAGLLMAASVEGLGAAELVRRVATHVERADASVHEVAGRVRVPEAADAGSSGPRVAPDAAGSVDAVAPAAETVPAGSYPGDDAPRAAVAAWMAAEARRRGLPPELPVIAALASSDMRNLAGGPDEGIGYFRMRSGATAAAPEQQLAWFLDRAQAVARDRSAGAPDDAARYGDWAAAVEGSPADAADRYQLRLGDARALLGRDGPAPPPAGSATPDAADAAAPAGAPPAPRAWDAAQFGAGGRGGAPWPEARDLLRNDRVVLDAAGIADVRAGRIDPRVVALLDRLSKDHRLTISATASDHGKLTAGGSVSNHWDGRAVDIAAIDGRPVNPSNPDAREIAAALARLDPAIRPDEIGSPWDLGGPPYFTDADHQDHLHVGFRKPIAAGWRSPVAGHADDRHVVADAVAGAGGRHAGPRALAALHEARRHLGTPYRWGGSSPETGFDCSGLMQWAYAHVGIRLPRVSEAQVLAPNGTHVDRRHLLPGDLVFFRAPNGDVHHVGMSLGGDRFLHAPHTGDKVRISSLDEPYYAQQFTGGRRFDAAGTAAAPASAHAAAGGGDAGDARGALRRDAAEVGRNGSMLFRAVAEQEQSNLRHTVRFMKAVDPHAMRRESAPGAGNSPTPADAASSHDAAAPASDAYPGDGATREALARWLGAEAERHGLPAELPVMAALVESGLSNRPDGDADSVGLFQMRASVWDKGAYAGYARRPELQVKWFVDRALAVRQERVAAGRPIDDPAAFGEWIADIEQPLAAYRGRYQPRLAEARALLGR